MSLVLNSIYYSHTELLFHRLYCTLQKRLFPLLLGDYGEALNSKLRNSSNFAKLKEICRFLKLIDVIEEGEYILRHNKYHLVLYNLVCIKFYCNTQVSNVQGLTMSNHVQ